MKQSNTNPWELVVLYLPKEEIQRIKKLRDRLAPHRDLTDFASYLTTWGVGHENISSPPFLSNDWSINYQDRETFRVFINSATQRRLRAIASRRGVEISSLASVAISSALSIHENIELAIDPTVPWPNK